MIRKKSSINLIFQNYMHSVIWKIEKIKIENYFKRFNIDLDSILHYDEKFIARQGFNYSRELAFKLINLFEISGNYSELVAKFNLEFPQFHFNILGKDNVIKFIKLFFREPEVISAYGRNGYKNWYYNNARILTGSSLESIIIPFRILIQIYRKIFQILNKSFFILDDKVLLDALYDYFNKSLMRSSNPNSSVCLKKFGRISYLIHNPNTATIFKKYFLFISKFIRKIKKTTDNKKRLSYTRLQKEFDILFYHHQQVKLIIEDLNDIFNIKLKIGFNVEYRWHNLMFQWNSPNFYNISNFELMNKLSLLFDKIENNDYDYDIFQIINPTCSNFYISHTREKPLKKIELKPYIKPLLFNKIIITEEDSFIGEKLIEYTNKAEQYYKKNHYKNSPDIFNNENNIHHNNLQNYVMENDNNIIAIEVLVWKEINDINSHINYISGHIDFLIFYNNCLYICDYKPNKRDQPFFKSIPQVAYYGLILRKMLKIPNLNIKCIIFNKNQAWEFNPNILYTHIKDIIALLRKDYPNINSNWELYLPYFQ